MKRLLCLLLILCLLSGCNSTDQKIPAPTVSAPPETEAPAVTEPNLRDPQHELEAVTDGALTAYPLDGTDILAVRRFGEDLLVFDWGELLRISEDRMVVTGQIQTDQVIFPDDSPAVQVSDKGITYYDQNTLQLVFLDSMLREVRRIDLPEDIMGEPALSADRKNIYYFTASGLCTLNLDTGLLRLVRQTHHTHCTISGLHRDDRILEFGSLDGNGVWSKSFVDVTNGELLWETPENIQVRTGADRFFATHSDGFYTENLTGIIGSEAMMLYMPHLNVEVFPLLQQDALVSLARQDGDSIIDYYDLTDGTHPYSLTLPARWGLKDILASGDGAALWLLVTDTEEAQDVLCRWDLTRSRLEDDTVYIGVRRTEDNPDEYGLSKCGELAVELSETYGVEILLWEQALEIQPWDYYFAGEYQVLPINHALETLRKVLSTFPSGFFQEATSEMGDGILRISLVRGIYGYADSGALDSAVGIQFWEEETGNPYLCIQIGHELESTLYHELFHVLESRIYSTCDAYDNWNKLNPQEFTYDFNYSQYHLHDAFHLISGDTRAFVDYYSMTFPKEDRARVMEYASMAGNEEIFRSEIMQMKLQMLCRGIREAYGLEDEPSAFLWEQYLKEPIHPAD